MYKFKEQPADGDLECCSIDAGLVNIIVVEQSAHASHGKCANDESDFGMQGEIGDSLIALIQDQSKLDQPKCQHCGHTDLSISTGKNKYQYTCARCGEKSALGIGCVMPGHLESIRKSGGKFFRECAHCKTSQLFFINPT